MPSNPSGDPQQLAETIRQACLHRAIEAYEEARMDGLCHEGAWEIAVNAIQTLDLGALLRQQPASGGSSVMNGYRQFKS